LAVAGWDSLTYSQGAGEKKTPESEEKRYKISPKVNRKRSIFKGMSRGISDAVASPSVTARERRGTTESSAVTRVLRSPGRRLFRQELAEHDEKKKREKAKRVADEKRENAKEERTAAARIVEKTPTRYEGVSKKRANKSRHTHKKAKLTGDLGVDDDDEAEVATGYVLIDLTSVDVEEYERFSG
jgi:hypothetical protein